MGFLTRVGQRHSIPRIQGKSVCAARLRKEEGRMEGGTGRGESGLSQHFHVGRPGLYSGKFWFFSGHLRLWGLNRAPWRSSRGFRVKSP